MADSFENEYDVNSKLLILTELIAQTQKKLGTNLRIRIPESFYSINLFHNRNFASWLLEQKVSPDLRESKTYLMRLLDSPLIKNTQDDMKSLFYGIEIFFENRKSIGLAFAFVNDTFTFSFDTNDKWIEEIVVNCQKLDEQDSIERIRNITREKHLQNHEEWLLNIKYRSSFNSIDDFIAREEENFKNLLFSKSANSNLKNLKLNTPEFNQVFNKLKELDISAEQWSIGEFPYNKSKTSDESETRKNKFRNKLRISCKDGKIRDFHLHIRYTPGAGRIYFCPDDKKEKVHIGYIGPKLL